MSQKYKLANHPLVSVIIPTYNYAHYIGAAIESVLNQGFPTEQVEIIVYDDGSTDNTKNVVNAFSSKCNIKYYYQENGGKADATKKAIEKTAGKYIFNLDADDYYLPGKLQRTVAVFESDENIVHVASPATIIDTNAANKTTERIAEKLLEKPVNGNDLLEYFISNNILFGGGSTYAARASVLRKTNIPLEIDMYIDEFLLYSVLPQGKSFFIKESLSVWRVHGQNYSVQNNSDKKNIARHERSVRSSLAMLAFLKQQHFSDYILRVYTLKHATRMVALKEAAGSKNLADIFNYLIQIIRLRPSLRILKRYTVFNRLVPLDLINWLKKMKSV